MKRNLLLFLLGLAAILINWQLNRVPPDVPRKFSAPKQAFPSSVKAKSPHVGAKEDKFEADLGDTSEPEESADPNPMILPYKMKNGLMVVQGDIVAGLPKPGGGNSGRVEMNPVVQWPIGVIPYHIQPDLPRPERVLQALAFFEGTPIRFVPLQGQKDVLVFEPGAKDCLSFVGMTGGVQPIWLADGCKPDDIAHEILHALGFVHEQNRLDRDEYINVMFENIVETEADNFQKLPAEFMKVSGLVPFDFQSVMIYPAWMFAKNGQSTMEPKNKDHLIQPSTGLSAGDRERLRQAYR